MTHPDTAPASAVPKAAIHLSIEIEESYFLEESIYDVIQKASTPRRILILSALAQKIRVAREEAMRR